MTSVHTTHEALIDAWLKDYTDPRDLLGEPGWLKPLTTRVVARVLEAELTAHLGYAPHVRPSLREVPWRARRAVAADLRAIYGATTLTAASLKELGAEGLLAPLTLSCRDHEGVAPCKPIPSSRL